MSSTLSSVNIRVRNWYSKAMLGVSKADFKLIKAIPRIGEQPFKFLPADNDNTVWIEPSLVCIVQ